MSNNSWKQYGGISDLDNFNFINANTIVADQFISRSTQPTIQIFNGTFIVNNDLSAGVNVYAGNSIYSDVDLFVNNNIYSNNKIYFGGNALINSGNTLPARATDSDSAFLYGDISYVGVNITQPETIFHITGTVSSDTDILTIESKNSYIRNIISQNENQKGVVIDGDDTSANIHFYIDNSTDVTNFKNATIKYADGGEFSITTTNSILQSSRQNQVDTSGGTIFLGEDRYQVDSCGNIVMNSSGGYIIMNNSGGFVLESSGGFFLDTSGSLFEIDRDNANINIDTSGQIALHCSGGDIQMNTEQVSIMSDGSMVLHSSGGYIDITSKYETNINSTINLAPFARDMSGELYEETMTIYDNSNVQYLQDVYNDASFQTGNTMVGIGIDPSSNTFMRLVPAASLQGSAYGGGVYPTDTARSMNVIGVNDISGNLIVNTMIVEGTNKHKFKTTLGINTYQPVTEQYVANVNGPLRLTNGEINTVLKVDFELKKVSFSKSYPLYGIITGTPSSLNTEDFTQYIYYTSDGGATWNRSDVYNNSADDDVLIEFTTACMYDDNYGFIAGNVVVYYTYNGGEDWAKLSYYDENTIDIDSTSRTYTNVVVRSTGGTGLRIYLAHSLTNNYSIKKIRYVDVNTGDLGNNGIDISFNDIEDVAYEFVIDEVTYSYDVSGSYISPNYIYYAGSALTRFNVSDDNLTLLNASAQYYEVDGISDDFVVAVGDNIISYTEDGSNWNNITLSSEPALGSGIVLKDVYVKDASNIIAVGDNGIILYTTQGPYSSYWKVLPNTILNTNGMAARLNGSENQLISVDMTDDNTFIIGDVLTTSSNSANDTEDILGLSKVQYSYLPYVFNRDNNTVADVCGNMVVSGNIELLDGRLFVGQNSIFHGDVSMNSRLFVANNIVIQQTTNMEQDTTLSERLFVINDASFSANLFVNNNSIFNDDVSMNARLDVNGDISFNNDLSVEGDLIVTGNVNLTKFNSEYITNIETTNYSLIVSEDLSLNGRMFVEGDTSLNGNVFAQSLIVADDLSLNGRLFVEEDASLNGNVFAQSLFVAEDLSLNGRLHVNNDVSLNSSVYIDVSLGIGIHNPAVSMDVSKNDAIRIPRGNILERPNTTGGESYHAGYIRYNTENSQFEGYGPGDSWGSLGGVVNVLQNTKITAANPNADSQNNELLFFTSDASAGAPIQRMIIQPDGSVGIGTNYVPSYDVDINGNVRITLQCEATSFNATSDGRLKENIQPIYDSLSRVIQLNGVDFSWSNDVNKQKHAGLIAQDVEKVIPEVVSTSTCEEIGGIGLKSIEYNGIIPYLIESIKTLNDRVKDLESQMN